MAVFWIGTSGWNYGHWRGVFYPGGLPQRRWLPFYAGRFRTVELNYTHYRQPSGSAWDAWRDAVPPGFLFAVKAHRYLTHRRRLNDPEDSLRRVIEGARRLGDRLGPILYQLPPFFRRTAEHAARLERFLELLPGDLMHAFEFRHESWFGRDTLAQLERRGAAFCCYDMPGTECPLAATAPFAYVRFHGPGEGYTGCYTDRDLACWAERLRGLASGLDSVFVYFNNDIGGYAPANARALAELLGVPQPDSCSSIA